ncbi:nitrilase-related carbon-nitrogen hydrolase [Algicola sagamiensis]|uniref:nitrilase-related carbon-nitrogen hydrolase n=1 Tax=Algicola sagamiensis TaxID=163869 RepID=UPI00035C1D41|nr:nitrilase-related carbon-nitrogen hydrolase [Algicola sagamiensis]
MKVALVSLDQVWLDKSENFNRCQTIQADLSAHQDVDVVIWPEMTLTGFVVDQPDLAEEPDQSETIAKFRMLSHSTKTHQIFGYLAKEDQVTKNRLCHINPQFEDILSYDKIHTFSFAGEDKHIAKGHQLQSTTIGDSCFGFATCYDLRFPEIFTAYRSYCHAVVVIASWPASRVGHWLSLLRARAIENQCYLIGVNRVGKDGNGLRYEASSVVFDPMGERVFPIAEGKTWQVVEIQAEKVVETRQRFPFEQDRDVRFYKELYSHG